MELLRILSIVTAAVVPLHSSRFIDRELLSHGNANDMSAITIREFDVKNDDIDRVKAIFVEGQKGMWKGIEKFVEEYINESLRTDLSHVQETYFNRTVSPKGTFLVAVNRENKIVGAVGLEYKSDEDCELRRMCVSSEMKRQKVGTKLTERLLQFAKEQGYKRCFLSTLRRMTHATNFYQTMGFSLYDEENIYDNQEIIATVVFYERYL